MARTCAACTLRGESACVAVVRPRDCGMERGDKGVGATVFDVLEALKLSDLLEILDFVDDFEFVDAAAADGDGERDDEGESESIDAIDGVAIVSDRLPVRR